MQYMPGHRTDDEQTRDHCTAVAFNTVAPLRQLNIVADYYCNDITKLIKQTQNNYLRTTQNFLVVPVCTILCKFNPREPYTTHACDMMIFSKLV